ncbi:MAG: hypothetical protein H6745_11160 [Deltaproteobacteria bacterium]|nr:hypothetical protein [Deltaproteobacteria bacterium]
MTSLSSKGLTPTVKHASGDAKAPSAGGSDTKGLKGKTFAEGEQALAPPAPERSPGGKTIPPTLGGAAPKGTAPAEASTGAAPGGGDTMVEVDLAAPEFDFSYLPKEEDAALHKLAGEFHAAQLGYAVAQRNQLANAGSKDAAVHKIEAARVAAAGDILTIAFQRFSQAHAKYDRAYTARTGKLPPPQPQGVQSALQQAQATQNALQQGNGKP